MNVKERAERWLERQRAIARAQVLAVLPTLAELRAVARAVPKGQTRLQAKMAADLADERQLEAFRRAVFARDKYRCRCCGGPVRRTIALVPNRAEAHHIHGRAQAVRYDVRAGITLCSFDHQRATGKINDKLRLLGTRWFAAEGRRYIDATYHVTFKALFTSIRPRSDAAHVRYRRVR